MAFSFIQKWNEFTSWFKQHISPTFTKKEYFLRPPLHFLCLDDDRDFSLYMNSIAKAFNITLTLTDRIENAKEHFEKEKFDGVLVDGHLPDGSGLDFVAWIRSHISSDIPIAFLSRFYHDAESFRILKDKLKVDIVLEKPLRPEDAETLFQRLTLRKNVKVLHTLPENILSNLQMQYQKSIYDKIARLESLILLFQKEATIENLKALRNEVHKIAGNSGSYGFQNVSDLCFALEADLNTQIDKSPDTPVDPQFLASLDDFFTEIKFRFQESSTTPLNLSLQVSEDSHPLLYVINENIEFLRLLDKKKKEWRLNIVAESDPERAKEMLLSCTLSPQLLFVSQTYQENHLTAESFIHSLDTRKIDPISSYGLFVKPSTGNIIAKALKMGFSYILESQSDEENLPLLKDILGIENIQKRDHILILEEDPHIQKDIEKVFKDIGIRYRFLENESTLAESMKNNHTKVLLLDIDSLKPGFDPINFIRTIKEEGRYPQLNLIAMTGSEDLIEKIRLSNADEIIFKPIEPSDLEEKLLKIITKSIKYASEAEKDSLTQLLNHKAFHDCLEKKLKNGENELFSSLVLIEIKSFPQLKETMDAKKKEELLKVVADMISCKLKKYETAAYLEHEIFAFIFSQMDLNLIDILLKEFLQSVQKEYLHQTNRQISFTYAILALPAKIPGSTLSASQLIEKGRRMLSLASQQQKESIRSLIQSSIPFEQALKKQVEILDQDSIFIQKISYFFEQEGYSAHVTTVERILHMFQIEPNRPVPLLFIINGNLLEKDGLGLLKEIKKTHPFSPLFVSLSSDTPEQEIYFLLMGEELNYLKNPFPLIIMFHRKESLF